MIRAGTHFKSQIAPDESFRFIEIEGKFWGIIAHPQREPQMVDLDTGKRHLIIE